MSSERTSIRKDKRKKNCCLLPNDLALPDANCFIVHQGTMVDEKLLALTLQNLEHIWAIQRDIVFFIRENRCQSRRL